VARMVGRVEEIGRRHGVDQTVRMTVCVSDGRSLWAVRYASDGDAPTLYHSRQLEDLARLHPEVIDQLGPHARVIVSEPIGSVADVWAEVPQSSAVVVSGPAIALRPFAPVT